MKLSKLWIESISHFDREIQESLLAEQPHTRFVSEVPKELSLLNSGGFIDLGFENLGLDRVGWMTIMRAFAGAGVKIPGTPYRMRVERPMHAVIEPHDGTESAELPPHWLEGVLVFNGIDKPVFIGHRVRGDQPGPWDPNEYTRTEFGYLLNQ